MIPAAGYPSRTEAVVQLTGQGLCDTEIAARIGISTKAVAALRASSRRRKGVRHFGNHIAIPPVTLDRLRHHAERRATTANELARRLIIAATDEELVDAILDDTAPPMETTE